MADPSAAERAYRRLKTDILNGALPTGPIDIRALGDRMRMSVTPVREALARLSAERLVKLAPHHGYAVAHLSARRLENLYELTATLIDLAVARCETSLRNKSSNRIDPARDVRTYEAGMTSLAREIAQAQGNLELSEHIVALSERLFPARRCEGQLIANAMDDLRALLLLWDKRQLSRLQTRLARHFEMRIGRADAIARLLTDAVDEG